MFCFVFDSFILQRIRFQWTEVTFEYFLTSVCYKVKVKSLSCVRRFATPWTAARQAPPSMGFSRQGYWSGLPFPSPGHLPTPGIEPGSPTLRAGSLPSEPPGKSKNTGVGGLSLLQGNLPDSGIELGSRSLHADSLPAELPGKP